MVRILGTVLAIIAGAAAALLLASDVSATYAGETVACTTVINAAAVDPQPPAEPALDARQAGAVEGSRAVCHRALLERSGLAALAIAVCVAAGAGVRFNGERTATRRPARSAETAVA